jgi:hypothetical protein
VELCNLPVQMLAVCGADGALRPVRFRFEDGDRALRTVRIDQVLSSREIQYVGVEALSFLCRAVLGDREHIFELRYTLRTHRWVLQRVIC